MNRIAFVLFISVFIFGGCSSKEPSFVDNSTTAEFKRYSKSLRINENLVNDFRQAFQGEKWEAVKNRFKDVGGRDLNLYMLDGWVFLIFDTHMNFKYPEDMLKLTQTNEYKEWEKSVSPYNLGIPSESSSDNNQSGWKLMERIYKLEQKKEYDPEHGIVKKAESKNNKRYCMTLALVNDSKMIQEYKRVHSIGMAWPQITQNMKDIGIIDMEIYLRESRAFMIMETKPNFNYEEDSKKWGEMPGEKQWQDYVSKFQRSSPNSSIKEKWQEMEKL